LRHVEIVVRYTEGDPARVVPMVREVIDSNVALVAAVGPATLRAAKDMTSSLPIVAYDFESDPVAEKYAVSIAHPGGNVTGVFLDLPAFSGKWIELLVECVPRLSRIALIWDPATGRVQVEALTAIAARLAIQIDVLEARARNDYPGVFAAAVDRGAGAAILLSSPLVFNNIKEAVELSLGHKLPAITLFSQFARTGGLLSYGPSVLSTARQVGGLAGRVLMGATPANLPIERPTKFELLVNLRSAEMLGVRIPALVQARADEVIE
jgi:putative ABC transport system substrate-binding protein